VNDICNHAFQNGLDSRSLRAVVDVIAVKTELDQTGNTSLVKSLYPARRVPPDVVVTVVGGLGQGNSKPSLPTQAALLKWLVLVYDVLEDATILSRLYGVLFDLLDTYSLR
jgi:centromere protein I